MHLTGNIEHRFDPLPVRIQTSKNADLSVAVARVPLQRLFGTAREHAGNLPCIAHPNKERPATIALNRLAFKFSGHRSAVTSA